MDLKQIAFLGSKEIGYNTLKYLIQKSNQLNCEVVAVLTNNRSLNTDHKKSVHDLATSNHIPVLSNPDELLDLKSYDYLISVQYHKILKQKHIDTAQELAINLHMAPLPEYRGCNQFSFAIIDEIQEFGTTLHVLDAGIDSGDILFESRFPIGSNETVTSLYEKTLEQSIQLFEQKISNILNGNYTRTPQKQLHTLRAHNFHLRDEIHQIKQIDPNWNEEKIDRYVRATYFPPFPPPFFVKNGKKIELSLDWRKQIKS